MAEVCLVGCLGLYIYELDLYFDVSKSLQMYDNLFIFYKNLFNSNCKQLPQSTRQPFKPSKRLR